MSEHHRWLRPTVTLLLAAASVLGLMNVYSDGDVVEASARHVACSTADCSAQTTRIQRTPFGHEYGFALAPGREVQVRCRRAWILLGEWSCQRLEAEAAGPPSGAPASSSPRGD